MSGESEPGREVEAVFVRAARAGRLVWLAEPDPVERYRVVEPYMVYRSGTGRRLLHAYQVGGYSAGGPLRGWRNLEPGAFAEAQVLEEPFAVRPDYNPFNEQNFPHVAFALPTADGRRRAPDAL